ncbi:cyclic lactone autoinducer peptide [Lachnospiraceae bacterium PF1-21]
MKGLKFGFLSNLSVRLLSKVALASLLISTMATNQRCWYVMYEEELPKVSRKKNTEL